MLGFFKGKENEPLSDRATAMRQEYLDIAATLEYDFNAKVNGDGTYAGYKLLRDFYEGRQWSYKKDNGGTMRTYNYCYTIVENYTAFLTNEPPQMSSPPVRLDDPVERALAEGRTKILEFIHEDNSLPLVFQRGARCGSMLGDTYIYGAIPTFKNKPDGTREFDRIRYWNVERPETIRPIWKDDNYTELHGFVKHYRIATVRAKSLFANEIAKRGFVVRPDNDPDLSGREVSGQKMTTVKEIWTETEYLLLMNNTNQIVDYIKHDWGFVPLLVIPNTHRPGHPTGTSDLENELDPQMEYNERASDLADIIKEIAQPTFWGKNLDSLTEIKAGNRVVYSVGDDAELNAMPASGQTAPLDRYLDQRKNDIIALSGMNQVMYPGSNVMQATGRALSVLMQGVNNKIALRKEWWIKSFKELNRSILFHAEKHIPNAKQVINGYYKTDVFIASVLLRSVSDEINKFQSRLQSQTTTMKNIGVPNPSEEQKLMREELEDPILATEIAKQPGLLHQIVAERAAAAQQAQAADEGPALDIQGGNPNIASESDNVPGEGPTAIAGQASPVSAAGAAQQLAQRNGAAPKVQPKR